MSRKKEIRKRSRGRKSKKRLNGKLWSFIAADLLFYNFVFAKLGGIYVEVASVEAQIIDNRLDFCSTQIK